MGSNGTYPPAVEFQPNAPMTLALKYRTPKILQPKFPGGDERCMFSLVDGRTMFLDADDAHQILELGIQPGQPFNIEMKWTGRRGDPKIYHVWKDAGSQQASAPSPIAAPQRPRNYGPQPDGTFVIPAPEAGDDHTTEQLRQSLILAAQKKIGANGSQPSAPAPQPTPKPQPTEQHQDTTPAGPWDLIERQTQRLIDMYAGLCQYAAKHGGTVGKEDVRALLMNRLIAREGR